MVNPEKYICFNCKHHDPALPGCKAYPEGIPYEISELGFPHDKVRPDQKNNLVYEPINKKMTTDANI